VQMVRSGERTPAEVARLLQVHPSTIGRIVAQAEAERTAAPEAVPCPGSVHRR
jgi:transposase-like protein